jgi:hypothetical protein
VKPIIPRACRRVAVVLPALSLMLAPLAAQTKERADPERESQRATRPDDAGGRAGVIEEFNLGPPGTDVGLRRQERQGEGGTRLLSGRVVGMRGRTLYVERNGMVVPLDVSALRIHKQPKVGQQIIATYDVDQTQNVAVSLAGEVPMPPAD